MIDLENIDIFNRIINWYNMKLAYYKTQKGKPRLKYQAMLFKQDSITNLYTIKNNIINGLYKHHGYNKFVVYEPKMRIIYAPNYIDKIVQHMINNVLRDIYEPTFIFDSYACIRGKGNQAAVKRIQYFQRCARYRYDKPYHLKLDISKFFYTIDRDILKQILKNKIKDSRALKLIYSIIDSFTEPLGLPLGNLTSQLFANIYLNEIDQLIKRKYKVNYYVRYADDMFLIVENKEIANRFKIDLINEIQSVLRLTVNPKKVHVVPYNKIHGLGFTITPDKILILGKNKYKLRKLIKRGVLDSLSSWYGYAHISNCHGLIKANLTNKNIQFTGKKFIYIE